MIQGRGRTRFASEAFQGLGIVQGRSLPCVQGGLWLLREPHACHAGQELQGHLAAQARVLGLVDHSHASTAQPLEDAVMRDGSAHQEVGWASRIGWAGPILSQSLGRYLQGGTLQETPRFLPLGQQRFHILAQGLIPGAGFCHEPAPQAGRSVEGGVVQPVDSLPTLRLHPASPVVWA